MKHIEWIGLARSGAYRARAIATTRRRFLAGTAAVGAAALATPARAQSGGTLKVRSYGDFQVLDPANRLASSEDAIFGATLNKLIEFDTGTEFVWHKEMAESIEQVDPLTVKFTIRPGIMWSNGFGETTTEDVKFSFERIAGITDPNFQAAYRVDWEQLREVEIIDAYSGVIHLKKPFAPLWTSSLPYGSGSIVCKRAVEAVGGSFTTEIPAINGPYFIKEWQPKQKTVLALNPSWTGPKPAFDEIVVFPIEDDKSAELAYEAGEVDITGVSISGVAKYREALPPGTKLMERAPLAYIWLGLNQANPKLADVRVRRAIQQAVDVGAIIEGAYFGVPEPSTGIIAPSLLGHRQGKLYGYDPDAARAMLAEAGAEGLSLKLAVLDDTDFQSAAQIIQANLAAIGVNVEIDTHDSGTFWTLGDKNSPGWDTLDLILNRFTMAPDPSWATEWFTPRQIGIWNWEQFNSEEFDKLHQDAISETDLNKRAKMYVRMQDLMEESGSYVFITHGINAYLYRDTLIPGVTPDGQNFIIRGFGRA
ncbi:MAG: ABC transporter substrate-binding protein [Alphaproteobacteria bacterium]